MSKPSNEQTDLDAHLGFRTRHQDEMEACYEKLMNCFDQLCQRGHLSEEEKISLKEYALTRDYAALHSHLEKDPQLAHADKIKKCHEITLFCEKEAEALSHIDFFLRLTVLVSFEFPKKRPKLTP